MTTPNFFDDVAAIDQVEALSGMVFERVRRGRDLKMVSPTDDLVRETIGVLEGRNVTFRHYGEQDAAPGIVGHPIAVTDQKNFQSCTTIVHIEATTGDTDKERMYLVALLNNPDDDVDDHAHYFDSVHDFVPVLVAIGYFAKTKPGRPVTWDDIATVVYDVGDYAPIGPWVWEWAFKAGASSDN